MKGVSGNVIVYLRKGQGHEVESTNHKMSCDGFGFCVVCGWPREWMQTLITRPSHLKHKRSL